MPTAPNPTTCFIRPIRADLLPKATLKLRARLVAAGAKPADALRVARGIVASARHGRDYLDGMKELLRARGSADTGRALRALDRITARLAKEIEGMAPAFERVVGAAGDGREAQGLADAWFEGGGPQELAAEGRLRNALSARLSALGPVRISDLAHLACLWSDSQRLHAALRGSLASGGEEGLATAALLEALSLLLRDHVLPVDLQGLPGDPGLRDGLPAMSARLSGPTRKGRAS